MTFLVSSVSEPIRCEACGKLHTCGQGLYYACDRYLCIECLDELATLVGGNRTKEETKAATERFIKERGPVV